MFSSLNAVIYSPTYMILFKKKVYFIHKYLSHFSLKSKFNWLFLHLKCSQAIKVQIRLFYDEP